MKNLITILIMFVAAGCSKTETETETKIEKTEKPMSLENSVVGSYEIKFDEVNTLTYVFLETGKGEYQINGEKVKDTEWEIVGKEVHLIYSDNSIQVHKIEPNGDLTSIAGINHGKREEEPKEEQNTFKKLKE